VRPLSAGWVDTSDLAWCDIVIMFLELHVRPTIAIITILRRSIMRLYEHTLGDPDASARVGLATHELLENVLRHSATGDTVLSIRIDGSSSVVSIETTNRAAEEKIASLRERVIAVAEGDPEERYRAAMEECLTSDEIGGLGLARVRAEGGMTVRVHTQGDMVHVVASTTFRAAA
jgi:anti-sigma regulatory factor (Ser/Thr protein kinase)